MMSGYHPYLPNPQSVFDDPHYNPGVVRSTRPGTSSARRVQHKSSPLSIDFAPIRTPPTIGYGDFMQKFANDVVYIEEGPRRLLVERFSTFDMEKDETHAKAGLTYAKRCIETCLFQGGQKDFLNFSYEAGEKLKRRFPHSYWLNTQYYTNRDGKLSTIITIDVPYLAKLYDSPLALKYVLGAIFATEIDMFLKYRKSAKELSTGEIHKEYFDVIANAVIKKSGFEIITKDIMDGFFKVLDESVREQVEQVEQAKKAEQEEQEHHRRHRRR